MISDAASAALDYLRSVWPEKIAKLDTPQFRAQLTQALDGVEAVDALRGAQLFAEQTGQLPFDCNIVAAVKSATVKIVRDNAAQSAQAGAGGTISSGVDSDKAFATYKRIRELLDDKDSLEFALPPHAQGWLPQDKQRPHPEKRGWTMYVKTTIRDRFMATCSAGYYPDALKRKQARHVKGSIEWIDECERYFQEHREVLEAVYTGGGKWRKEA